MSLVLGKNPSNELKEIELTNSGLLKIDVAGSSGTVSANVDVTGNTIGLSTSANQSTMISSLGTLAGAVSGTEFQVDVVSSALPTGAATSAAQSSANASLASLVSANATETTLSSVDTSAQSIDTSCSNIDTNTTNIDTSTSSIASDTSSIAADTTSMDGKITQGYDAQIASGGSGAQQVLLYARDSGGNLDALQVNGSGELKVTSSGGSGNTTTNVNEAISPGAGNTANSTAVDMDGSSQLTIFGSSTNTSDSIVVQVSHNNSTWVEHTEYFINMSASGGNFAVNISNTGARYWRVSQTDTLSSAFTLTVNSSKK